VGTECNLQISSRIPKKVRFVKDVPQSHTMFYGTYVKGKKDAMVTTDLLLGMLSEDGRMARKAYREYVDAGMGEGVRNPFAEVYGGVILGSRGFIKEALGRVKEAALDQAEIAQRRELHKLRSEDVIDALCSHFGVPADRFGEWGTALRDMAIYLLKRHTSVVNRQIGDLFQGLSYSGVSKANHRFSVRMSQDKDLRKTVDRITRSMSNVKA
jgi:hypothetical protein